MVAVKKSLHELNEEFQDKVSRFKLLSQELQNTTWFLENNKNRFMLKTECDEKIKKIFESETKLIIKALNEKINQLESINKKGKFSFTIDVLEAMKSRLCVRTYKLKAKWGVE